MTDQDTPRTPPEPAPAAPVERASEALTGGGIYKRGTDYQASPAVPVEIDVPQAFVNPGPAAATPSNDSPPPSEPPAGE